MCGGRTNPPPVSRNSGGEIGCVCCREHQEERAVFPDADYVLFTDPALGSKQPPPRRAALPSHLHSLSKLSTEACSAKPKHSSGLGRPLYF